MPILDSECTYDFSRDEMPPEDILDQIKTHDRRMEEVRAVMQRVKAAYETEWVNHIRGQKGSQGALGQAGQVAIEVNSLYRITAAFLAALYPGVPKPSVTRDPSGRGDAEKARRVLAEWVKDPELMLRLEDVSRQALHYYGAGVAVGYDPGTAPAWERVWMRVVPCWELVLDVGVADAKDARFIGRVHFQSLRSIARRYNLNHKDLHGVPRADFLSGTTSSTSTAATRASTDADKPAASSDGAKFVRVLEICNFVDTYTDEDGDTFVGRLEVYLLDQADIRYKKPIWIGPMNLSKHNGDGLAHIIPLIFDHEAEAPLRPLCFSKSVMPQVEELNCYRTRMAQGADRANTQTGIPEGMVNDEEFKQLVNGSPFFMWDPKKMTDLGFKLPQQGILKLETGGIPASVREWAALVEQDLQRMMPMGAPAVTREPSGATAFELGMIERYTDSENGRYGKARNLWLSTVLGVVLRAIIAAMYHRETDSLGSYEEEEEVALSATDAHTDDSSEMEEAHDEDDDTEDIKLEPELVAAVGEDDDRGREDEEGQAPVETPASEEEEVLIFLGEDEKKIEIRPDDLDANFRVNLDGFGAGAAQEAEDRKSLFEVLPSYLALWEKYLADRKSPIAQIYLALLYTYAEKYRIPESLHPETLLAKIDPPAKEEADPDLAQAASAAKPPAAAAPAPAPAAPPPTAPTPAPAGGASALQEQLEAILAMPPQQGLLALAELLRATWPEDAQKLEQATATAPPEQQQALLEQAVTTLLQMEGAP